MSGMAFCGGCGAQISEGVTVCPICGAAQGGAEGRRTFASAIRICFEKYATFRGRAPRAEFWYWTLFVVIVELVVLFAAGTVDAMNGIVVARPIAEVLLFLVFFLPGLAVAVRRLHDRDRSGWWYLLVLIPVVGAIILFVWYCMRGTRAANRFGPDPLAAGG
jgi:uncharacterized membrane protein YhaH (DUF805 family)